MLSLLSCSHLDHLTIKKEKEIKLLKKEFLYKIPRKFYLKEFPPNKSKSQMIIRAIKLWNKWLEREQFVYEKDTLVFLLRKNKVFVFDGKENTICEKELTLLGYAIPDVTAEYKVFSGRIYLCEEKISFMKRMGWPPHLRGITEFKIFVHELGHLLVNQHLMKSQIMYPYFKENHFPNKYDREILFPALR